MEKQFTSTAYIIENGLILLIFHRKLKKWLPAGGHMDANETPEETAIREAFEETGLEIELILQENIWVEQSNAKSFPRPYLCLLEEIPEHQGVPAHQHIDFCYIARPIGGQLKENKTETDGIRWFSEEKIDKLQEEHDIFLETKLVIKKILSDALVKEACL